MIRKRVPRLITLLLLLLTSLFSRAMTDTALVAAFSKADLVAHIRLGKEPLGEIPVMIHDVGTEYYTFRFKVLEVYKQRFLLHDNSFTWIQTTSMRPMQEVFTPGEEYIAFLAYADEAWSTLLVRDILPYDANTGHQLQEVCRSNTFDRAVSNMKWNKVERMLRRQVKKASRQYGKEEHKAEAQVYRWLESHNTVDVLNPDSCASHICIYPGWSDAGIRFLTPRGPVEYILTLQHGKVRRWGYVRHRIGLRTSVDKIFFRSFRPGENIIAGMRQSCFFERYQRISYWKKQDDVSFTTTLVQDTIRPLSMIPPLIRVRTQLKNTSAESVTLLWPNKQTDGYEILLAAMLNPEGQRLEEDGIFLEMPDPTHVPPSLITLQPGDSVSMWHSIKDPYCFQTDASACHDISFVQEGRWKLGMKYAPLFSEGDTTLWWYPEGNTREYWNEKELVVESVVPVEEVTVQGVLVEEQASYTNDYGQQGRYNALVRVTGAPAGSPFKSGDLIACRHTVNTCYLLNLGESRPACDTDLMQPGDPLELDMVVNYPPDRFTHKSGEIIFNYLLSNSINSLRIRR